MSARGFGYRNCTDFVAWLLGLTWSKFGFPALTGNAADWGLSPYAGNAGLTKVGTPTAGDIAWWDFHTAGGLGHVAVVTAVASDGTVTVADYNAMGTGSYWVHPLMSNSTGYLHPKNAPTTVQPAPKTLTPSAPPSVVASRGFIEFQPLTFSYTATNTSGSPASIKRFSVPVRAPEGSAHDLTCDNGVDVSLAAGQSFTCNATISTGYGQAGAYTYRADWMGYDNQWHTGQLGPQQQFTLAPG